MGALNNRLVSKVVLCELSKPSSWMLFVIISNLSIDCGYEHVPFGWRKSSTKGSHNFWSFSSDSVVIAVYCFVSVDIIFHYTKISKVRQEELERSTTIVRVGVENWPVFSHSGEQGKTRAAEEYRSKKPLGEYEFQDF